MKTYISYILSACLIIGLVVFQACTKEKDLTLEKGNSISKLMSLGNTNDSLISFIANNIDLDSYEHINDSTLQFFCQTDTFTVVKKLFQGQNAVVVTKNSLDTFVVNQYDSPTNRTSYGLLSTSKLIYSDTNNSSAYSVYERFIESKLNQGILISEVSAVIDFNSLALKKRVNLPERPPIKPCVCIRIDAANRLLLEHNYGNFLYIACGNGRAPVVDHVVYNEAGTTVWFNYHCP